MRAGMALGCQISAIWPSDHRSTKLPQTFCKCQPETPMKLKSPSREYQSLDHPPKINYAHRKSKLSSDKRGKLKIFSVGNRTLSYTKLYNNLFSTPHRTAHFTKLKRGSSGSCETNLLNKLVNVDEMEPSTYIKPRLLSGAYLSESKFKVQSEVYQHKMTPSHIGVFPSPSESVYESTKLKAKPDSSRGPPTASRFRRHSSPFQRSLISSLWLCVNIGIISLICSPGE